MSTCYTVYKSHTVINQFIIPIMHFCGKPSESVISATSVEQLKSLLCMYSYFGVRYTLDWGFAQH